MTRKCFAVFFSFAAMCGVPALALDDVTLFLMPVGGSVVNGHETVHIEVFATTHRTIPFLAGQHDLPCVVNSGPGGLGTLTWLDASADLDGDQHYASSAGIPYLYGDISIFARNPTLCQAATTPFFNNIATVPAGATRYLGTHLYLVSDCAAGDFTINFECADQPGGVCDNVPESTNSTRYYEDPPPMGGPPALLSLQLLGTTLTVPTQPCCSAQGGCLSEAGVNSYCCETVMSGCTTCRLLPAGCAPAIFGDAYPPETFGDGLIDVDDILCVRDNFVYGPGTCPSGDIWPCGGGDGIADVDDLVAVIGAFIGQPRCPDPCE